MSVRNRNILPCLVKSGIFAGHSSKFCLDHLNISVCNYDYISSAYEKPTYGELIYLLEEVEQESPNDESLLYSKFKVLYPNIYVGRPRRFYETLTRLAAPTKSSLRGKVSLTGSPLTSYRKRTWQPRLRNLAIKGRNKQDPVCFVLCIICEWYYLKLSPKNIIWH